MTEQMNKHYIDWTDIPHLYTGSSIIFFIEDSATMLEFIRQEIQSGGITQFAVLFGTCRTDLKLPDDHEYVVNSFWQLSCNRRNYEEKVYA